MMFPLLTHSRLPRRAAFAALCAGLLLPLAASAQDAALANWPIATPPPGANPATFPVPRNDWLQSFIGNMKRAKANPGELVFDGDSITAGWIGNNGKGVWEKNFAPYKAADFGIGGDRTEHVLWRLQHGQLDGLHPKLVLLMIGTNNSGGNSEEQITEGVTACVNEYRKRCPDAVILLQAIFPRSAKAEDPIRQKLKNINANIAKLADGKKTVYMDFSDKFLEADGTLSPTIMPDFLHPNAKGYEIWADAIRPEIEKVMGPVPAK